MTVDDRCVAWVRTLIDGQVEEGKRLAEELAADGGDDALVPLLYYSFVFAVRELFGGTYPDDLAVQVPVVQVPVVQVLARVRAQIADTGVVLDPEAAESEIRHALGDREASRSPDADARSLVHVVLLKFAVREAELDRDRVDGILAQARQSVEHRVGTRAGERR